MIKKKLKTSKQKLFVSFFFTFREDKNVVFFFLDFVILVQEKTKKVVLNQCLNTSVLFLKVLKGLLLFLYFRNNNVLFFFICFSLLNNFYFLIFFCFQSLFSLSVFSAFSSFFFQQSCFLSVGLKLKVSQIRSFFFFLAFSVQCR